MIHRSLSYRSCFQPWQKEVREKSREHVPDACILIYTATNREDAAGHWRRRTSRLLNQPRWELSVPRVSGR
jgi:hypothetical protein